MFFFLSFSVLAFIASGQIIYNCYSSIRDEFFSIVKIAKLSLRNFTFGSWTRQAACVCVCAGSTNFLLSLARLAGEKSLPFISFSKRQKFLDTEELRFPDYR